MKEVKFKKSEIDQMISYCEHAEEEGWYYGREDYFRARHKSIMEKLLSLRT